MSDAKAHDGKLTFKAWFVTRDDGEIWMIDDGDAALNCCDGDDGWFGPFAITIPIPDRIREHLANRDQPIEGTVVDD